MTEEPRPLRHREAALLALGLDADQLRALAAGLDDPHWRRSAQRHLLEVATHYERMEQARAQVRAECAGLTWLRVQEHLEKWQRRAHIGSPLETARDQEYRRIVGLVRAQGPGAVYVPERDSGHRVGGGY